jgi:hypothetical protein
MLLAVALHVSRKQFILTKNDALVAIFLEHIVTVIIYINLSIANNSGIDVVSSIIGI